MLMEGEAPRLLSIALCSKLDYEIAGLDYSEDFYVEGDVSFPGSVSFIVKTGYKVNWPLPAFIEIPVTMNISVS